MRALHAVIMAGGSGTRFWPASRQARPKQLLPLAGGRPLVAAAVERLAGLVDPERIWIVTNARQKRAIGRLLLDFPTERILAEPEARDTAPCVAFAMAQIAARDPDALLLVSPADHVLEPAEEFRRMVRRGVALADDETLVTFGVPPTFPATGYGYVELGAARDDGRPRAHLVRSFREKPDAETARRFVDGGAHWWNSGILLFSLPAMRRAMRRTAPELADGSERMAEALRAPRRGAVTRAFKRLPRTSIDYAVLEKADRIVVVECTARWDDVGSFPALSSIAPADDLGNHRALFDGAHATAVDSRGNVVYAEGRRTVALLGVEDLVVAAVGDAVLVCPKDRAGDLKQLVERLRADGRTDLL